MKNEKKTRVSTWLLQLSSNVSGGRLGMVGVKRLGVNLLSPAWCSQLHGFRAGGSPQCGIPLLVHMVLWTRTWGTGVLSWCCCQVLLWQLGSLTSLICKVWWLDWVILKSFFNSNILYSVSLTLKSHQL